MKFTAANAGVAALLSAMGLGLNVKHSTPTPKKPWQLRPDYVKQTIPVKNPKVAEHIRTMHRTWHLKKFGTEPKE